MLCFPPIEISNNGNVVVWISHSLSLHPSDECVSPTDAQTHERKHILSQQNNRSDRDQRVCSLKNHHHLLVFMSFWLSSEERRSFKERAGHTNTINSQKNYNKLQKSTITEVQMTHFKRTEVMWHFMWKTESDCLIYEQNNLWIQTFLNWLIHSKPA